MKYTLYYAQAKLKAVKGKRLRGNTAILILKIAILIAILILKIAIVISALYKYYYYYYDYYSSFEYCEMEPLKTKHLVTGGKENRQIGV